MYLAFDILKFEKELQPETAFIHRYILPNRLHKFLLNNYKDNLEEIGRSEQNSPIYKVSIGTGELSILLWTQMHGNETTGTLSCLDLLKFLNTKNKLSLNILKKFTLDFIFMLNPDGSEIWKRRNALDIDINRDYLAASSVEMRILQKIFHKKNYILGFNLHDQRTIFGVGQTKQPTTLSFLSPSVSDDRSINEVRQKSMGLIAEIYKEISRLIPGKIARYSDEFYPRSVGDNFQKNGLPTILFEGGHFPQDYSRQKTRKYFTLALISALYYAVNKEDWTENYKKYFEIPENSISFYDIIYKNVQLSETCKVDLAVQYTEKIILGEEEISFIARVEDIGDLSFMNGHEVIDANNKSFYSPEFAFPKIGMIADFQLGSWNIINGKKVENIV